MKKGTFATVIARDATGDEPTITISTAALDRDQDELIPEGASFTEYLRNPVVQYGHDSSSLPVGATTRLDVLPGKGIRATWKWLTGDPFADRVKNAFDQGVLRAASVGFLPTASEPNGQGGKRFTKWTLLEWSLVNLPANPDAVRVLRSLGLWPATSSGRSAKQGRRHSVSDEALLKRAHLALRELGSSCKDLPSPDPDDADIIDIDDDNTVEEEQIEFEPRDLALALREVLPGALRSGLADAVQMQTSLAIARARGRVVDDPLPDPLARHHHRHRGQDDIGFSKADVTAVLRDVVAAAVGDRQQLARTIREQTHVALRRARGRVD